MAYKRVLVSLPEEMLEEVDRAAKSERRQRSEFVREALRDRIERNAFKTSLGRIRSETRNDYSEEEVDRDVELSLEETRNANESVSASR